MIFFAALGALLMLVLRIETDFGTRDVGTRDVD